MASENVKEIVKNHLSEKGAITSGQLAALAKMSRQAAHANLVALVADGTLRREGAGRGARYVARTPAPGTVMASTLDAPWDEARTYTPAGLQEDRVWEEWRRDHPGIAALDRVSLQVVQYAFTEMLNNAIDHANARNIMVQFRVTQDCLVFAVTDDGIGAFTNIQRKFHLQDEREAIAQISKGKMTTAPDRHTGEGLFFVSKLADLFLLSSHHLSWVVDNRRDDMTIAGSDFLLGTRVRFDIDLPARRTTQDVFAAYTTDLEFDKTHAVVKLFQIGDQFMSRSEAKRLLMGFDKFSEVVLDFAGVVAVGQGFVDEVFRVWTRDHPVTRIVPVNMSDNVAFMVKRGLPRG